MATHQTKTTGNEHHAERDPSTAPQMADSDIEQYLAENELDLRALANGQYSISPLIGALLARRNDD